MFSKEDYYNQISKIDICKFIIDNLSTRIRFLFPKNISCLKQTQVKYENISEERFDKIENNNVAKSDDLKTKRDKTIAMISKYSTTNNNGEINSDVQCITEIINEISEYCDYLDGEIGLQKTFYCKHENIVHGIFIWQHYNENPMFYTKKPVTIIELDCRPQNNTMFYLSPSKIVTLVPNRSTEIDSRENVLTTTITNKEVDYQLITLQPKINFVCKIGENTNDVRVNFTTLSHSMIVEKFSNHYNLILLYFKLFVLNLRNYDGDLYNEMKKKLTDQESPHYLNVCNILHIDILKQINICYNLLEQVNTEQVYSILKSKLLEKIYTKQHLDNLKIICTFFGQILLFVKTFVKVNNVLTPEKSLQSQGLLLGIIQHINVEILAKNVAILGETYSLVFEDSCPTYIFNVIENLYSSYLSFIGKFINNDTNADNNQVGNTNVLENFIAESIFHLKICDSILSENIKKQDYTKKTQDYTLQFKKLLFPTSETTTNNSNHQQSIHNFIKKLICDISNVNLGVYKQPTILLLESEIKLRKKKQQVIPSMYVYNKIQ